MLRQTLLLINRKSDRKLVISYDLTFNTDFIILSVKNKEFDMTLRVTDVCQYQK